MRRASLGAWTHRLFPLYIIFATGAAIVALVVAGAASAGQVAPFVGAWQNDNPATGEQTRAVIDVIGPNFTVFGYGARTPTDCDWAELVGGPRTTPQSDATDGQLSIVWDFGFKTTSQTLTLLPDGRLNITSFHHFTDGSGRPDRTSNEDFHKTTPPAVFFTLQLAVAGTGHGAITSVPDGLNCPGACSLEFRSGTSVQLNAIPDENSTLVGWQGACAGRALACKVAVGSDATVTATFARKPQCVVPRLKTKTITRAKRALVARHCTLKRVKRAYSVRVRRGQIIAQNPAAGTVLPHDAGVTVVVSRGRRM
jgi:hypothetical protein